MHVTNTRFSTDAPLRHRLARGGCAALALAVALCVAAPAGSAPAHSAGLGVSASRAADVLRGYTLRTLDGVAVPLGSLQGEIVVVSFWASWCSPCRRELPRLDALNERLSRQGGRVLAVSIDEDRQNCELFARKHGLKLAVLPDGPNGLARQLDLRNIPFTLVLDRQGRIAMTTSATDDAGLDALAAATGELIAGRPLTPSSREGDRR